MLNNSKLNDRVISNFSNVKYWFLAPPGFLLLTGCVYFLLFIYGDNYASNYANLQKDLFYYLNDKLSQFASLQFNLTQLGDALIIFPLITVFIIYAPKIWEGLLISSIISLIASAVFKKLFAMPRPAAMFDNNSFVIIGKTLSGNNSLPSGHSITTFIVITTLLFAFMPKKPMAKIGWFTFMILLGFIMAFSRVGVGAHYPIDVLSGASIGFMLAIIGIKLSDKITWFSWIKNKKYYPFFIALFSICIFLLAKKITVTNLIIFYISIISLIISLYILLNSYAKKKN